MRTISAALAQHLQGDLLTTANCVQIKRTDGVTLGYTSCPVALNVAVAPDPFGLSMTYEALDGVDATAIRQSTSGGVDNLEFTGLITLDGIRDDDLLAGRYDNAKVTIFLVNYNDLAAGPLIFLRGRIGQVSQSDGTYTAEIRSHSQMLAQSIGDLTSLNCRVRDFGDAVCKFGGQIVLPGQSVTSVSADGMTLGVTVPVFADSTAASRVGGELTYGKIAMISGECSGLLREIKQDAGTGTITLQEAFPLPLAPGDACTLYRGCDRSWGRCAALNNTVNFQGEPFLPGNDKIIQQGR